MTKDNLYNAENHITQAGYDNLVNELDELVAVKRKEVAGRLKEAISYGDLSENAEYDAAKDEQAELEERINFLESRIRNANVVKSEELNADIVSVGLTVKVKDLGSKEELSFIVVGSTEADPFDGKLSCESILGKSLLGKKRGAKIEIQIPDGISKYKILSIEK
ncbi:MAG: transcription elongation factor GreA [Peptostreptococcaceae bacterium]|nr:transcription elongation factor GreA [Peptostreptococcaceae bacterium]